MRLAPSTQAAIHNIPAIHNKLFASLEVLQKLFESHLNLLYLELLI